MCVCVDTRSRWQDVKSFVRAYPKLNPTGTPDGEVSVLYTRVVGPVGERRAVRIYTYIMCSGPVVKTRVWEIGLGSAAAAQMKREIERD